MYELSAGRELVELDREPQSEDYEHIEKGIRGGVVDALNCIFETSDKVRNGELTYSAGLDKVTIIIREILSSHTSFPLNR